MPTKLPGFIRDASLSAPRRIYRSAQHSGAGAGPVVVPQFMHPPYVIVMRDDGASCICYEDEELGQSICDCEKP
jgi:hypothetical protein